MMLSSMVVVVSHFVVINALSRSNQSLHLQQCEGRSSLGSLTAQSALTLRL
jgi:hypothetical protein